MVAGAPEWTRSEGSEGVFCFLRLQPIDKSASRQIHTLKRTVGTSMQICMSTG